MGTECLVVPPLLSSFVDAFVDFSVGGIFFPLRRSSDRSPILKVERLRAGDAAKQAFSLAGLVDSQEGRWKGGSSVAVQVGDVLDRGGEEIRLMYLLHRLKIEASRAGGALHIINGNHEVMNVALDFRFATPAGIAEFERWGVWYRVGMAMKRLCDGVESPKDPFEGIPSVFPDVKEEFLEGIRARIAALRPDGPISRRFLAGNQTVVVVGDSVFVHGGLLRDHVEYGLERLNDEVRDWIEGSTSSMPRHLKGRDSLVWLRRFSDGPDCDCTHLEEVLSTIPGAKRMNRAIRVDVGLSKGCTNGLPEVLEIVEGKQLRVLTSNEVFRHKNTYESSVRLKKESVKFPESMIKDVEVKA
ncbi:unnamed protein product [Spirodela intermedia]|uniref:Uncharacterized protein n=1 Tax=Spirodela intermedia TaxID=51605 RepID=A0A7I8JG30_SPIIN|nr:unnamed protein product [Spirodela intermedia]CAA6668453.1 unnamed protein product [Spirodela intermedia]